MTGPARYGGDRPARGQHSGAIAFQVHDGAAVWGKRPSDLLRRGNRSGTAGGGGNGLWFDQLMVTLVKIYENHVVPNRAAHRLRRPPRLPQTPVGTNVLILLADDDHGLTEQGDHQRVTTVRDRRDEIDEVPSRPVGRSHLSPKDPVVRRDSHAPKSTGALSQEGSLGRALTADTDALSAEGVPPATSEPVTATAKASTQNARAILFMDDLHPILITILPPRLRRWTTQNASTSEHRHHVPVIQDPEGVSNAVKSGN